MLKIHTSDGKTHRIDLANGDQAKEWLERLKLRGFQETITGMSVVQDCRGRIRCPNCKRAGRLVCQSCERPVPSDAVIKTGVQYSLSRPDGYRGMVTYAPERIESSEDFRVRGGEKVTCFFGDSRATMMVHTGQPSVRFTLLKTGRQRYNPSVDGWTRVDNDDSP